MSSARSWKEPEPSFSEDAEMAVLGCILLEPHVLDQVRPILRAKDFYQEKHRLAYEGICNLAAQGSMPEEIALCDWLKTHDKLEAAGGDHYIRSLSTAVPDGYHAPQWAKIILEHAERRAMNDLGTAYVQAAHRKDAEPAAEIAKQQARLEDVQRRMRGKEEDTSLDSPFASSQRTPPPPMRAEAYHGLAGAITRTIAPHTEADPDGVLVQVLAIFGAYAGRKTCFKVSADRHYPNLYVVLVGDTASGRKGMSWGAARYIFTKIPALDDWLKEHTIGGMSSGEGLIHPVRDCREAGEGDDGKEGKRKPPEPLQLDKRVLVRESEFSSVLKMPARDGNNLSEVQRRAWDGDVLQTLTKNSPERATGAHITIIGNITREELARYLSQTDTANGFANRYIWVHVARSRLLPDGGELDTVDFSAQVHRLQAALQHVENLAEHHIMTRDAEARELWHAHYERLTTPAPGLFGAMTARAAAQVMRLAMIYALLDCEQVIRVQHLEAALAVWEYVENTVRYLFGDALGDPIADTILRKLRTAPEGMTRTAISELFARHAKAADIDRALALLQEHQFARCEKIEGEKGRPSERWFIMTATQDANTRTAKEAKKVPPQPPDSIISLNSQFAPSQECADGADTPAEGDGSTACYARHLRAVPSVCQECGGSLTDYGLEHGVCCDECGMRQEWPPIGEGGAQ